MNQKYFSPLPLSLWHFILVLSVSISRDKCNFLETLSVQAFEQSVYIKEQKPVQKPPLSSNAVNIEMPNFDELFSRISIISPLAKMAIERKDGGFLVADESASHLDWQTVEKNTMKTVSQIDKINNYNNLGTPLLRWRSSLKGPCFGYKFAEFIMNLQKRKKWDVHIEEVSEMYPVSNLEEANTMIGSKKYGKSLKLGIGYCRTKSNFVVSGREQLTLCGVQEFENNAALIWGIEMEDKHNHLLPQEWPRIPRARTQIFSTALVPTGPNSFDAEYCLQMSVGGKIPPWMTTPVISETVKSLFKYAEQYFGEENNSDLDRYVKEREAQNNNLA